jgi:hypothetical protein
LGDLDLVLQGADLLYVLRIVGVDQRTDQHQDVSRADTFPRQRAAAAAIVEGWKVVILVEHLHRHVAPVCLGHRDGDRARVEIEHALGI